MDKLFIGIDVGSRNNAVCIMKPDGSKHSSFSMQNNLGGAQTLSKRGVSALNELELTSVVIGMLSCVATQNTGATTTSNTTRSTSTNTNAHSL